MGQQDLYLHPSSFSGVIDEASIQPLQEQLSKARTFRCYHVDRYEEYRDLSDEAYRAELEAKRDEITSYVLEKCRTKRSNLYIVDPVAIHVAERGKTDASHKKSLRANQLGTASKNLGGQRGIGPDHRTVHHPALDRILRNERKRR